MLKKLMGILLAGMVTACAWADEDSLKKSIEAAYPKVKVQSVTKTPFPGLFEVFIGGQIIYTDEKFSFLLVDGRLIDQKSKQDLTTERLEQLTRIDFKALPLDKAIKVVKGNGSRKLVVFSDPDCPYCKKLEQKELLGVNDITVYTFLFPLDELHPNAAEKSRAIWCAKDRTQAWEDWIFNGQLPKEAGTCDTPIGEIAELGRKLGISSTPTLILEDGRRLMGAYPSAEIEAALKSVKRK